jgi:2-octaprenyl-6-methoxyphenol hydroxylase
LISSSAYIEYLRHYKSKKGPNALKKITILISGGGYVGRLMAILLAKLPVDVRIIDPQRTPKGGRAFSIAHGTAELLESIGLWSLLQENATSIQTIAVTQEGGSKALFYKAQEVEMPALGYMVMEEHLDAALTQALRHQKNVSFMKGEVVKTYLQEGRVMTVLQDGQIFQGSLLIASEGRHSPLRRFLSSQTLHLEYRQKALVGVVSHTEPHHHRAFEHFTEAGPLAFLPLPGGMRSAFVWSLRENLATFYERSPEALLHGMIHHFGHGFGSLSLQGPLKAYPLSLVMPLRCVGERQVLIGDAAHAFHPLAGQGLNVSFRDAFALFQTVEEGLRLGLDVGSLTQLRRYQKSRDPDRLSMGLLTHLCACVPGSSYRLLRRGVDAGFWFVDAIPSLKKRLTMHATGKGSFVDL